MHGLVPVHLCHLCPAIMLTSGFFFLHRIRMSITFMFCRARATRLETKTRFATGLCSSRVNSFALRLRLAFFSVISFLFAVRSLQFALSVLLLVPMANLRDHNVKDPPLCHYRVRHALSLFEDSLGTWLRWTWSRFCLEIGTLGCRFTFALYSMDRYGTSYKLG